MGVKDMLNKFVGTIGGSDDDYETDEFEDEEPMVIFRIWADGTAFKNDDCRT